MSKKVVVDASCLISLSKISRLDLLNELFGLIFIPQAVYHEVVVRGEGRPGSEMIAQADWIQCVQIKNTLAVDSLRLELGRGESEAIILAREIQADFIILDDYDAKQAALSLNIPVIGTVGILKKAEEKGYIKSFEQELSALKAVGFYYSLK